MHNPSTVVSTALTTDFSAISSAEEELTIIWFCENIEEANNNRLFQAFDSIHLINNSVECIQLISSMGNGQKLFLILTDENGLNLLETVKSKCTYIYFVNIYHYQLKDSTIFRKVFDTFDQLIRQLRIDIRMTCEDRLQFNFFTSTAQSIQQLDKESAEFIWFHALINAMQYTKLQQMKTTKWYNIEKNVLLNKCRLKCNMNQTTLKKINLFEETYRESDAVKWYAEDTFIYRFINTALRSNNIEEIIQYRFFIADLHCQLKLLFEEQFSEMNTVATVYRGQAILKKELNLLKYNIGNLITIKSFLSTTWDRDVALNFVITQIDVPDVEPVLFEIKLDTNLRQNPFACISEFTPMNEDEVLLSVGFVFRIKLVKFDRTGKFWIVELISEPETDQIKELLEHTKKKDSSSGFAKVLYGMGEYMAALRYTQWYIANFGNDDLTLALYCITMATTYKELGEHDNALACMRKSALTMFERAQSKPLGGFFLSSFYYTLGLIYLGRDEYHTAIYIFQKSLKQLKENAKELQSITKDLASQEGWEWMSTWEGNPDELAKLYNNLGFAYMSLKQYRAAYHYLSKGMELQLKFLPKNHYHLAVSYSNLGGLYKNLMDYQNALKYYTKALYILKLSRQPKHISILRAYEKTAEIYEMKYDYPMALENYQYAFNYAINISDIIGQLMNIARMCNKMKQHQQAIEVSERAARLCREQSLSMTELFTKKGNIMVYR